MDGTSAHQWTTTTAICTIPETWANRILGSTELSPQHCQMPNMTPHQHFCALTDKLTKSMAVASATSKGQRLLKFLQEKIKTILNPPSSTATPRAEQRVSREQQRVIDKTPILTIPQITDAPPTMQAWNPTTKRVLKNTLRVHQRVTRNNTPGGVPQVARVHPIPAIIMLLVPTMMGIAPQQKRRSPRMPTTMNNPPTTFLNNAYESTTENAHTTSHQRAHHLGAGYLPKYIHT